MSYLCRKLLAKAHRLFNKQWYDNEKRKFKTHPSPPVREGVVTNEEEGQ